MQDEEIAHPLATAVRAAERGRLERLRAAWHARLRPADEAEACLVDAIVAQWWRLGRLDALEERVMVALIEGTGGEGLPAWGTILRARNRLDKDRDAVDAALKLLTASRPAAAPPEAEARAPEPAVAPEPEAAATEALPSAAAAPAAAPAARPARPAEPGPAAVATAPHRSPPTAEPRPSGTGTGRPSTRPSPAPEAGEAAAAPARLPPEVEAVLAHLWSPQERPLVRRAAVGA